MCIRDRLRPFDPAVLQQAAAQLAEYLESSLAPGQRRPEPELSRMIQVLRQVRQQGAPHGGGALQAVASDTARYGILDTFKRLQKTVSSDLEGASEKTESWEWLRSELQNLRRMLAGQDSVSYTHLDVYKRQARSPAGVAEGDQQILRSFAAGDRVQDISGSGDADVLGNL